MPTRGPSPAAPSRLWLLIIIVDDGKGTDHKTVSSSSCRALTRNLGDT
ncbi:hypothetical protein OK016_13960 [Vibrio chagasii]|nr:hypothetical protein [Vibrio chagasii]